MHRRRTGFREHVKRLIPYNIEDRNGIGKHRRSSAADSGKRKRFMRICHLTSVHTPFDTRIFHRECRTLAEAGHEVHLITRHGRDETVDGVHIHSIPSYDSKIKRMLFAVLAVYRKALEGGYDVYHFHDPELIPVGVLLKLRGKKVVYDVHEDYPVYFRYKEAFPRPLRRPLAWLMGKMERAAGPVFDAVVAATPTIYERFSALNRKTRIVHNFPSRAGIGRENPGPKEDAVVYVGSLTLDRGIEEMIEAVNIARSILPVRLLLAGDFGSRKVEEYVKNLPGFSCVDFHGHTSRDETTRLLSRAKIGMVVCRPQDNYRFAYPTKLFEYMAAGLPVIASDFALWREIIEGAGCGLTVDPTSPGEIADAIVNILRDPVEARAMGERGKRAVREKYNWEKEKEKLLGLYEDIS